MLKNSGLLWPAQSSMNFFEKLRININQLNFILLLTVNSAPKNIQISMHPCKKSLILRTIKLIISYNERPANCLKV